MRILLVEDQLHQSALIERMLLRVDGVSVVTAENGRNAMDVLLGNGPTVDLILTDLQMPEMDGVSLLRHLGSLPVPPPVILMSAEDPGILGAAGSVAKALDLDLIGVVEKPITSIALLPLLERTRSPRRVSVRKIFSPAETMGATEIADLFENGAVTIHIQPKARISDRKVVGGEALVRMVEPNGALIAPNRFIPIVEADPELSYTLTKLVTQKVVETLARWPGGGMPVPISVNLPVACLTSADSADQLIEQVITAGIDPSLVCWEVTETATISNFAVALEILTRLRLQRFSLSIDDYGTGHSSLDRLAAIPFTEVKLDRVFVSGCASNARQCKIIASTAQLARELGLHCIAEGAETEEEVVTLGDLGVEFVQGFVIARPMPVPDFLSFAGAGTKQ